MHRPKKLLLSVVAATAALGGCGSRATGEHPDAQAAAMPRTEPAPTASPQADPATPVASAPAQVATPAQVAAPAQATPRPWRAGNGKTPPADGSPCVACANDAITQDVPSR